MPKKLSLKNRRLLLAGAAIVVVGGGLGLAYLRHRTTPAKTATVTPMGPETPQVDKTQPTADNPSSPPTQAANSPALATDQTKTDASLGSPSGQLAGTQPPPNGSTAAVTRAAPSLSATCLTLAGATCVVQLTDPNGATATVNPSSNNDQGNFTFSWSAGGYATGTWQVKLVATKAGQTGTANIGPLTVEP